MDEKALSRVLGRHDKNFVFKIAKRHDELFPDKPLKRRFAKSLKGDFRAACLGICFGANEADLSGVGEAAGFAGLGGASRTDPALMASNSSSAGSARSPPSCA